MPRTSPCVKALLLAGFLSLSIAANAFEDRAGGVYLEGGHSFHGELSTNSVTLGALVPWAPTASMQSGPLSFYGDFFISQWRAYVPDGTAHHDYTQIGAIANWRYRFEDGASPWFAEAGIGATTMNDLYHTPDRRFSTRFQFTEQIGIGRSFGERGEHELSVRFQHFSNADIKKPNPGENFVRVRYAYRF